MTTELIKCTCKSEFQDKTYGQGIRVGNTTSSSQYRCTVCGTVSGTKATATAKMPVLTAAPTTTVEKKPSSAPVKKKSGGNSGGSKDIKKEPKKKKSMKGTKR